VSPDVSIKKILVLAGTLFWVSALGLSACTSRLIPPSTEYLSSPEPEKVQYISEPPYELAKSLFSSVVPQQSKEAAWSNAVGKWVVWTGNLDHTEPQLKPSRMVFLYKYETPLVFKVIHRQKPPLLRHLLPDLVPPPADENQPAPAADQVVVVPADPVHQTSFRRAYQNRP